MEYSVMCSVKSEIKQLNSYYINCKIIKYNDDNANNNNNNNNNADISDIIILLAY